MPKNIYRKSISGYFCFSCKPCLLLWIAFGPFLIAGLIGCVSMPETNPLNPDINIPKKWSTAAFENPEDVTGGWIGDFGDNRLKSIVDEAMKKNYDLRIIAARLEAARAGAVIAGANLSPSIDSGFNAHKQRTIIENKMGQDHEELDRYSLALDISWEFDLWGKIRDTSVAGLMDARAAEEDLADARFLLAAKIAKAWFEAVEANLQTLLAKKTVVSYASSAERIKNRYKTGIGSALDLRLAHTELANARATVQNRKRQQKKALRALQVLIGRYPDAAIDVPGVLPTIRNVIPAGLPSSLLDRRPDMRAARLRFNAAELRVSSAKKDLLPSFTLTGSAGTSSEKLRRIVDGKNFVWEIIGGLLQPVFQGGRLRAAVQQSQANLKEEFFSYWNTALRAFKEVENALDSESYLSEQEIALSEAVAQAEAAEQLALSEYSIGVADIITMLDSQRSVFSAKSDLLMIRKQRLQNRVDLHLALGGHFANTIKTSNADESSP